MATETLDAGRTKRLEFHQIIAIIILSLFSVVMIFPFVWMIVTSFKVPSEVISYPPTLIPRQPTLNYYVRVFTELNFLLYSWNSLYISIIATLSTLFTSSIVGYVFAKFRFRWREPLFLIILSTMMIPFPVTIIPLYLLMHRLGWIDSHLALIVPQLFNTFGIFLMRQFMHTIPSDLRDAGRIDGCSELRIFLQIVLPLCKPALAALAIFIFMWSWDSFVWPLIALQSTSNFTLPVGLAMFSQEWWTDYGLVMAGASVAVVPVLIVFLSMQKQFIRGIVLTGLKG